MNIDFDNPATTSIKRNFHGYMPDGRSYRLFANWTDQDGWSVHIIMWDEAGTKKEEEEIKVKFLQNVDSCQCLIKCDCEV